MSCQKLEETGRTGNRGKQVTWLCPKISTYSNNTCLYLKEENFTLNTILHKMYNVEQEQHIYYRIREAELILKMEQ